MTQTISSQIDWERIKSNFGKASDYNEFTKRYRFEPTSRIHLTGKTVGETIPKSKPGGPRYLIFTQAMLDGSSIEEVFNRARVICSSASSKPKRDCDIFIALYNNYVTIIN